MLKFQDARAFQHPPIVLLVCNNKCTE
ncbi:hypothetical protein BN13_1470005 [Nostocoides jenkinsii Ben 74]|uniref:Uncharacterized protein n=1 Tax=Nostocoides jenkinsii Ben 74 TaxID=1193518 RepID=A0A077M4F1_9MICO|nr:hypothetical protein BN13_1470005 [Tetrasphaera jenkinsii Ben 74]